MKSINYLLLSLICIIGSAHAQTNVKLTINHKQGSSAFGLNNPSKNNLDEDYNAHRLEYYMSEISLEHDNGMTTELDSFWILVDVKGATTFNLGQFNITDLEAIRFSIGVEKAFNHLDPSIWATGHPLAPKSPSMHWGWSAGYRFFAMEGKCGSSLNYIYEFHSLGDDHFFPQRIPTSGTDDNGDILITLNANYDRVLENIQMGTGLIEHGEFPLNIQTLKNIRDYVFTSSEGNRNTLSDYVGITDETIKNDIRIYPNPSIDGNVVVETQNADLSNSIITVYDQTGRIVSVEKNQHWNGSANIRIEEPGYYILSISNEFGESLNKPVVVTR